MLRMRIILLSYRWWLVYAHRSWLSWWWTGIKQTCREYSHRNCIEWTKSSRFSVQSMWESLYKSQWDLSYKTCQRKSIVLLQLVLHRHTLKIAHSEIVYQKKYHQGKNAQPSSKGYGYNVCREIIQRHVFSFSNEIKVFKTRIFIFSWRFVYIMV